MSVKKCTKCKKEYPAIAEYFTAEKRNKNKLRSWCRQCCNKAEKERQNTINGHLRHIYNNIKTRCGNPIVHNYSRYGGRGIKNKFESANEFVDYVVNNLKVNPKGLQIDRIDNNGHYEKGNIRFVTCKENNNNRWNNKK